MASDSNTPSPEQPENSPEMNDAPMLVPESSPQRIVLEQRPSSGRVFGLLGWIGMILCFILITIQTAIIVGQMVAYQDYFDTTNGIEEKHYALNTEARDKVAIITVRGVIMDGEGFVKNQIDRVRGDENVKAVVLRVDSPGGTVTGSDYILHHLKQLKRDRNIPIVVSMGGMAASGGYYVSMAVEDDEDSIYAEPTTTTGSIGVIIPHYDLSGLLEDHGIRDDSISSGEHKQMLSMTKEMDLESRAKLDEYVNESFENFKTKIEQGRPLMARAEIDDCATGEIFTAQKAKDKGLIDKIGFIEEAIARAITLAKLDKDNVRVVRYKRPATLLDAAGLGRAQSNQLDLSMLLDLTAPRACYLATWLPGVATTKAD